jgi:predicted HD superfamily hydrolase involved in NAD metabolism
MIHDPGVDRMRRYARDNLTHDRYRHSLCVMVAMERTAPLYGLNVLKAAQAGILHDLAKERPTDRLIHALITYDPQEIDELRQVGCLHNVYLHGPAAVPLARDEFGVSDPEILEAIRKHAGSYTDMSQMARCLHVADMTAPAVDYPGLHKLQKLFKNSRLDEAELLLDTWLIEVHPARGIPNHPAYFERIRALTEIVKPSPDFFSRDDPPISSAPHP